MALPSDLVSLKGGFVVPVEAVVLLLDLERRGFTLSRKDKVLWVCPASQLTDADRTNLRRWKSDVLALIDYEPLESMVQ